ncbi:hypothetical protein RIF29_30166 [Crotalaria pallida]|uniref:Uncharacterized protein n=1 Tax=Crotalaria pallida TaxID=3830 RepID=A0AAN9EGB9_CROPI
MSSYTSVIKLLIIHSSKNHRHLSYHPELRISLLAEFQKLWSTSELGVFEGYHNIVKVAHVSSQSKRVMKRKVDEDEKYNRYLDWESEVSLMLWVSKVSKWLIVAICMIWSQTDACLVRIWCALKGQKRAHQFWHGASVSVPRRGVGAPRRTPTLGSPFYTNS